MMLDLQLSPQAHEDLTQIWCYIARDNETAATGLIDAIEANWLLLREQPYAGMARPDIAPEIRHQVTRGFVSLYEVHSDAIVIIRVLDGRQTILN